MKPQLLKVTTGPAQSFAVRQDVVPYINNRWHYHEEIELIYFRNGSGTQFIGDSIKNFKSGDLIMVGSNLPHYWRFDDVYFQENSSTTADVTVTHFCENFWGSQFLNLIENLPIKTILEKARRGIQISGKNKPQVVELLQKLLHAEGTARIIALMEILTAIANCSQLTLLSSIGFNYNLAESETDRINAIYQYTLANFRQKIQLEEIAAIANISPNSFCRYFKSRTRKTYSQFLIEIKVGYACKLLIENKFSIKQLCYESGFHNFASFHKYFKLITGKSPLNYQKEFINKNTSPIPV